MITPAVKVQDRNFWILLKIGMQWHQRCCLKVQSQAPRVNMWPGSHVMTEDAHLWLESHLCNQRHTYATGVAYWWCHLWLESQIRDWWRNMRLESQLCDCSSRKVTREHAHQNSIYSRPIGSYFSFPSHVQLYFCASNIDSSSQQDKISTSNTPLLLPKYIK